MARKQKFTPSLGDVDRYLLAEGSDLRIYEKLGAHVVTLEGVRGTRFAVWAPNASRVSVVGDFNHWNGNSDPMYLHRANGIWELFLPNVSAGAYYKYEVHDRQGRLLPLKSDPFANYHESPPGNASVVYESSYAWQDQDWVDQRKSETDLNRPVSIYEVHLGSWRRNHNEGNRYLSYRELAAELVAYVRDMGFTHIELLPVTEYPFDGSWGYQPVGLFAPTQRFGTPDDFRFFVDECHRNHIAVIVDWVAAHFPKDKHGLGQFDGTALYEHADPRKGEHADWGTLIFNFGRREVANYLIGSALYLVNELHIDALRVDAVASMLYLDYSREEGEWLPNKHGGNENLEAVELLKRLNTVLHAHGATTYAEESTAWPGVSRPVDHGGLGFTYKWNMGWMNDTLSYVTEDSLHRKHHHDKITFSLMYAFDENFVLPLSHDEVVHGKRSLLGRMPGDDWQRFANLRAYYGYLYAHPGKKLLFMGSEFAQEREWAHDRALDWGLLDDSRHARIQCLVRDLNDIYRNAPALYEVDFSSNGFEWINCDDRDRSILAWVRRNNAGSPLYCIVNFTPVVRHNYRVGVCSQHALSEMLNTDSDKYGGSNVRNATITTEAQESDGRPYSVCITLPPLATIYLKPENH